MRQFDCEEVEYNVCSVPACVVSRNTLVSSKKYWYCCSLIVVLPNVMISITQT